MTAPSVEVVTRTGTATFARAVADEFEPGILTVTWTDDERTARVFQPSQWVHAYVRDGNGFPLFAFSNVAAQQTQGAA
jgi:hypothetical protein